MSDCGILNPFACYTAPAATWIGTSLQWFVTYFRPYFLLVKQPVDTLLTLVTHGLNAIPPTLFIIIAGAIAWQAGGPRLTIGTVLVLCALGFLGVWADAMTTLAIVLAAVSICIVIGIPLG